MWSIVHVLSSYGVGGQERVALDLAIGQQARGHEVSVISLAPPPDGAMAAEFAAAGIAVGRVEKRGGWIIGEGDARREVEAAISALAEPRWVVMTGRRMDVPQARPRVRRVRAVVDDRGPAARRPRGDGGRPADRDDRGRRPARRRR